MEMGTVYKRVQFSGNVIKSNKLSLNTTTLLDFIVFCRETQKSREKQFYSSSFIVKKLKQAEGRRSVVVFPFQMLGFKLAAVSLTLCPLGCITLQFYSHNYTVLLSKQIVKTQGGSSVSFSHCCRLKHTDTV